MRDFFFLFRVANDDCVNSLIKKFCECRSPHFSTSIHFHMKSIVQLVLISSQNYTLTLGCLVISRALQRLNSIIIMTHDRPRKKERRKAESADFRV